QAVTDLDAIRVWGFTQGGWMINGWGGGGGGGYWGGTSTSQPTAEEECMLFGFGCESFLPTCESVLASAPSGCDLRNPPPVTTNGCGAGPAAGIVPDLLIVNGVPAIQFGNVFTTACDDHDVCYGTFKVSKHTCDQNLESDMIQAARDRIPPLQWPIYEIHVRFQAALYRVALENMPIRLVSQQAYSAAQQQGKCRNVADAANHYGCLQ